MKLIDKIKNNVSTTVYSVLGVVTLVASISMLVWCIDGEREEVMNTIKTDVFLEDNVQKEYLVGQEINMSGIYLNVKDKKIPASECTISNDFSSSGLRSVTLTYPIDQYNSYEGSFDVNVLFVRNIFVERLPSKVVVNENNTFSTDDQFLIYAELASRPETSTFVVEEKYTDKIVIALDSSMYTTNVLSSAKTSSFYTANLYCGNLNYSFNFYNDADQTFIVNGEKDIVKYRNVDNTDEEMTLVVTSQDQTYQTDCIGTSQGYYIFNNKGEKTVLPFNYQLSEKQEHFLSENVVESLDYEAKEYSVTYQGKKFVAEANLFQSAVVNGLIYDDNGYKMVIDSDARRLDLTYEGTITENKPRLTLYVTDYHFESSTGSGISQGFYMYTNKDGQTFKIRFYLQTWTWDHVPLSVTKTDVYATSYVGDYLTTKYSGALNASVSCFVRGVGWSEPDLFSATFDQWRLVAYNMA